MYGPRILLLRLPLIMEAITMVIPTTGIIMLEGITDMVGTLEEVGIGIIIPMVATRIEEIIGGPTGPAAVGVVARRSLRVRETLFPKLLGGRPLLSKVQSCGAWMVSWRSLRHIVGQDPERRWSL